MNKKKIINDPVYGFITLQSDLIYDLVAHPYFQRLRYIKQTGMTHLVYPGALHTRFHHALGAMHLMQLALDVLKNKGHHISAEEEEAAQIAILLHDIGHGPFSHALEHSLVSGIAHEKISMHLMYLLNQEFDGKLALAIQIFNNQYPKRFLYQLISGQLDLDRMDYLSRDSFFTGVTEGMIGFDRIVKMFDIHDGNLAVEEKGIYSIEKFLIARRLMYWQVYLHKTVVAAEYLLVNILKRAKEISGQGMELFATPALTFFLQKEPTEASFFQDQDALRQFCNLDDQDIHCAIKVWTSHPDFVLSYLCKMLIHRNLPKIELSNTPPNEDYIEIKRKSIAQKLNLQNRTEINYFVSLHTLSNTIYDLKNGNINILTKNKSLIDISMASDHSYIEGFIQTVEKFALSYVGV